MSFINNILKKFFGEKSDKDIKEILPIVEQIKSEYANLANLSNDDLRAKTEQLKQKIQDYIASDENEISELKKKAESTSVNVDEKDAILKLLDSTSSARPRGALRAARLKMGGRAKASLKQVGIDINRSKTL